MKITRYPNTEQLTDLILEADRQKMEGNHQDAIKTCERILVADLTFIEAYEEIGDNYISLKKYAKARKALEKALDLEPASANANYLLGFVNSAQKKWDEAIRLLEKADFLQPNHPEILRCLGWAMFQQGQRKRGIILIK